MRDLKRVILHCSATPEGREVSVEDIRSWHTDPPPRGNGWSDIGYHYVIHLDGLTEMGRPVSIQGAHTSGENEDSVGVCYIGGLDTSMAPKDTMTVPQEIAFVELVKSLRLIFGELSIHGHNEYSTKACPSFSVEQKFGFLNK
jgi:N-acetylmuramoyl-L-alanine amidase|tara:strand:- start:463 stop:891 length:429 start_codon:yes stop_codon:yes gene_type:complete